MASARAATQRVRYQWRASKGGGGRRDAAAAYQSLAPLHWHAPDHLQFFSTLVRRRRRRRSCFAPTAAGIWAKLGLLSPCCQCNLSTGRSVAHLLGGGQARAPNQLIKMSSLKWRAESINGAGGAQLSSSAGRLSFSLDRKLRVGPLGARAAPRASDLFQ